MILSNPGVFSQRGLTHQKQIPSKPKMEAIRAPLCPNPRENP